MAGREWVMWDSATAAARPEVGDSVERFVSLDTEAGEDAAEWLRDAALANDGSTRTRLLLADDRVEAYFSLCAGQVRLDAEDVAELGLPSGRLLLPAIVLAWIARHRDSDVRGLEVMHIAFGIARRVSREIGAVAFVLDPRDETVGRLWRSPPYGFRASSARSRRLWLPLNPDA